MNGRRSIGLALSVLALGSPPAGAWPADLSQRIAKDALRLVPQSLAELFVANERDIFAEARISDSKALSMVYLDLAKGRLTTPTKLALGQELSERARALQGEDFRSAVVALGATYRVAVDLADPGVGSAWGATRGRRPSGGSSIRSSRPTGTRYPS